MKTISAIAFTFVLSMLSTSCTAQDKALTAPPSEVMALYDIATAPSAKRIQNDIQTLVDFGTRHTLSETKSDTRSIGAALGFLQSLKRFPRTAVVVLR